MCLADIELRSKILLAGKATLTSGESDFFQRAEDELILR